MQIPLTSQEFFDIFREYNQGVWPAQWIAASLCVLAAVIAFLGWGLHSKMALGLLSVMSLWIGIAYFWAYYVPHNSAGWIFGGLFVCQGLLLAGYAFRAKGEDWFGPGIRPWVGAILVAYAIVGYPAIGLFFGHSYPAMPVLGIAPCPSTIFLIGMLLAIQPAISKWLFVIPIVWSALATTAALQLGVWEDLGLTSAGIAALTFSLSGNGAYAPARRRAPKLRAQ